MSCRYDRQKMRCIVCIHAVHSRERSESATIGLQLWRRLRDGWWWVEQLALVSKSEALLTLGNKMFSQVELSLKQLMVRIMATVGA